MIRVLTTFKQAVERRELLAQIVISQLKAGQKDFYLGYAWWILDPLLLMLIYWFLIGIVFGRGGEDYPLIVLCGLVPYRAFAVSMSQGVSSVSGKFGLMGQINFPRIYLPVSHVLVNHLKLIPGLVVVIVVSLLFNIKPSLNLTLLIIPFTIQIMLVSGIAMILSVLGVYFRDLKNMIQYFLRVLLYFSAILYPIESVPDKFIHLCLYNPVAILISTYRKIIMEQRLEYFSYLGLCAILSLLFMVVGFWFFIRNEQRLLKFI